MTATDRLSLLQYEHLGLDDVAAAEFKVALEELRKLALEDRYEHPAALHLGDIADAENRQELAETKGWGSVFCRADLRQGTYQRATGSTASSVPGCGGARDQAHVQVTTALLSLPLFAMDSGNLPIHDSKAIAFSLMPYVIG